MKEQIVTMKREKITKNTVRFSEVPVEGQPPVLNTLYVQKWAAGDTESIVVTVKEA